MRRVATNYLSEGDIIAHPITNPQGHTLLTKGIRLNSSIISKLVKLGVHAVYIEDGSLTPMSINQVIQENTRKESIDSIKKLMLQNTLKEGVESKSKDTVDIGRLSNIIDRLVEELMKSGETLSSFAEIRMLDNYTYNHSVEVCIYSLIIGLKLKYTRTQLFELGLGALLHDVGKSKIPLNIINKPGILDKKEYSMIQSHPELGYEILRLNPNIPLLSAHVALQHHERQNGSGYPRRISKDKIHSYGYIVGIADMFHAIISEKLYRPNFSLKEAIEILISTKDTLFPASYVDAFLQGVAFYPNGYKVKVNSGDIALVIGQGITPLTPILKVIEASSNSQFEKGSFIDLEDTHNQLYIEEIVNE